MSYGGRGGGVNSSQVINVDKEELIKRIIRPVLYVCFNKPVFFRDRKRQTGVQWMYGHVVTEAVARVGWVKAPSAGYPGSSSGTGRERLDIRVG